MCAAIPVETLSSLDVNNVYNSMRAGISIRLLNSFNHFAPTAPSTTRWSQQSVTANFVTALWLQQEKRGMARQDLPIRR